MLKASRAPFRLRAIAAAIFIAGLVLTYLLHGALRESNQQVRAADFDFRVHRLVADIDARLHNYEQVLSGAAGLYAASPAVSRAAFRAYVASLKLGGRFPGIQGVGFAQLVPANERARHVAAVRAEGLPGYDIRPPGARDVYSSIVFLEPADWRNQRAIGYDMFSEPVRRAAMAMARDANQTAISGKVRLVQETEKDVQAGFLMYLPVYRPGATYDTVEQRRSNLVGWVYAPFRMNDLMQGILGEHFGEVTAAVQLQIHDGDALVPESVMFDSGGLPDGHAPAFEAIKPVTLFNHRWTVVVRSLPSFDARLSSERAKIVAWAGSLISLLLALVVWLLATARSRAAALAAEMTTALRQNEAMFRAVFDNVVVGLAQVGINGRFLQINEEFCRIIGYGRDEVLSQEFTFQQITFPDDLAGDLENVSRLIAGDAERYRIEKRYLRKDGAVVWVSLAVMLLRSEAGDPLFFISAVQDITERKALEESLRQNQTELLEAQRIARLGNWSLDVASNQIVWSAETYRIFGLEPQPQSAPPAYPDHAAFFTPESWDRLSSALGRTREAGTPYELELEIIRADGSGGWMLTRGEALRDASGAIVQLHGVAMDITERKQAEIELQQHRNHLEQLVEARTAALHEAEVKYRTVANFASDWETWIDPAGNWVYCSPSCERITGHAASEFIANPGLFIDIVAPEDRPLVRQHLQDYGANHPADVLRFRIIRPDGRSVWLEHACQPVSDDRHAHLGRRASNRDITPRVLAEEALMQAKAAAEAANRAKSAFLANMSHELRTPLNAVLGFSELMTRDAEVTPRQRESLEVINRSGQHLLGMINEVLDLSKIEAGRIELDPEPFDLHDLLDDLAIMFRVRTDAKGLRFLLERAPDVPRYIEADPGKLRQILINLLGNAVKFTAEGGIALRVAVVPSAAGERLVLEVEDSGSGIPAKDLKHIFEPFVQVGGRTAQQAGTGLGLTISQRLVQLMGGRIDVDSEPGRGSVFRVELPVEECGPPPAAAAEQAQVMTLAPDEPERRILVVDDKPENRLLLRQLLESAGFRVAEATSGEEALQAFASWQPHLIWMDMRMPGMDGYEATRRIRQLPAGNAIKILAVTASAFAEQRQTILAAGCDDVVHKPYRAAEIFDAMARHLGVRYLTTVRAAPAAPTGAPDMSLLPPALAAELAAAAGLFDVGATHEIVDRIRAIDPALASRLDAIANDYRFDEIVALCNASRSGQSSPDH